MIPVGVQAVVALKAGVLSKVVAQVNAAIAPTGVLKVDELHIFCSQSAPYKLSHLLLACYLQMQLECIIEPEDCYNLVDLEMYPHSAMCNKHAANCGAIPDHALRCSMQSSLPCAQLFPGVCNHDSE